MSDLAGNLRRRVQLARRNLNQAHEDGDDYSADTYSAELEDLQRRADAYQITIDPAGDDAHAAVPVGEEG
jgi:hypothetical protein